MTIFDKIQDLRTSKQESFLKLVEAPKFPTLKDICSKCLHHTPQGYHHCDSCGACVNHFHYHDFVCVNKSNENIWVAIEFIWLYLINQAFWIIVDAGIYTKFLDFTKITG